MRELVNFSVIALLLLSMGTARAAKTEVLSASESEEGVLVTDSGQPVLFYQRQTTSLQGQVPRAHYIHPLYGLDGEVFTEDFPPITPITEAFTQPGTSSSSTENRPETHGLARMLITMCAVWKSFAPMKTS